MNMQIFEHLDNERRKDADELVGLRAEIADLKRQYLVDHNEAIEAIDQKRIEKDELEVRMTGAYNHIRDTMQGQLVAAEQRVRELEGYRQFAELVVTKFLWDCMGDVDHFDLQEMAEKYKIIEPHKATVLDVDEESDFGVGDTIYRLSTAMAPASPTTGEKEPVVPTISDFRDCCGQHKLICDCPSDPTVDIATDKGGENDD